MVTIIGIYIGVIYNKMSSQGNMFDVAGENGALESAQGPMSPNAELHG